jgi:hypothetical protein
LSAYRDTKKKKKFATKMTSETATLLNNNSSQHNNHGNGPTNPSVNSSTNSSSLNSSTKSDEPNQHDYDISPLNDPNIKYPLENGWSFWFYKGEKSKSWKENVKFITKVAYVEDFWG